MNVGETAVQLDLWSPSVPTEPRYTLSVVDQHKRKAKNGPFAVFIVPQGRLVGRDTSVHTHKLSLSHTCTHANTCALAHTLTHRETDWLFSSDSGRKNLAESAGFERLIVVTLHRGHTYPSLDAVKEEVSGKVIEFIQKGLPRRKQVCVCLCSLVVNGCSFEFEFIQYPVLSLGDGLGSRVVLHEGSSVHSGRYVVEESDSGDPGEGVRLRRLVFVSTPHLAQSEIQIIAGEHID